MKNGEFQPGKEKMAGYNKLYEGTTLRGSDIRDGALVPGTTMATWTTSRLSLYDDLRPFRFSPKPKEGPRKERCENCGIVSMLPDSVDKITALKCPTCGAAFKVED